MKKNLVTIALCAFAFGLGFGVNNIAFSNINPAISCTSPRGNREGAEAP